MEQPNRSLTREERAARRRKRHRRQVFGLLTLMLMMVVALVSLGFAISEASATNRQEQPQAAPEYKEYTPEEPAVKTDLGPQEPADDEELLLPPAEITNEMLLESGILSDDIPLSYELQLDTREASTTFDVPYELLLAMMFRESSFQTDAHNDICWGLMQVHQMNFEWLETELAEYGVTDVKNDPRDNIWAGAYIIGGYLDKYGDIHKALMAYNCGEYGASKLWERGYESSQYSRNVVETMGEYIEG